jgi:ABC-type multidrug transport system ATPase subunit
VIRASGISKKYGSVTAIDDVSLDSRARERLMDFLERRARSGAAVVLAPDDPDVWRPVCHKVALLEEGQLRRVTEVSRTSGGAQELVAEVFPMGDD